MTIFDQPDTITVPITRLIEAARDLKSEQGENPEYDRALVELVAYATGFGADEHRADVEALLEIVKP